MGESALGVKAVRQGFIFKGNALNRWALGLAIASLIGCSTQSENSPRPGASLPAKPNVVASYNVLCHFTEAIAEATVNLTCLIPPGQDPHAYSSTPSDRRAMKLPN
ncbi:MAG: zinc ABC transporter solute-binding protein [Chloroflexaceae bacterium]|nr:zinc ABC transporter solute-binding protein [Chloroflexaceae bacterium]